MSRAASTQTGAAQPVAGTNVGVAGVLDRERNKIGLRAGSDFAKGLVLMEGACAIYCRHFEDPPRREPRMSVAHGLHFCEEAERMIAREAVGAEADVESEVQQLAERKWRMLKITAAPRAMRN